jgi:uncharacterized protein with beta-barrel porin domain
MFQTACFSVRNIMICGMILTSLALVGGEARAQDIDTTPSWNGSEGVCCWGVPSTETYGQLITPTGSQTNLSGFTFYLAGTFPVNFQAYVYAWNNGTNAVTGPALFTSAVMTAPNTGGSFTPVTINAGATALTPGQQYVLFLTTATAPNPTNGAYVWGSPGSSNPYAGGQFVYSHGTGSDFTIPWSVITGIDDLAFMAFFGPAGLSTVGLNENQTSIANNVNQIITTGGSPDFTPVMTALTGLPQGQLPGALNQLSPEIYNYQKVETLYAAEQFSADLQSCRVADGSGYSIIREGQCVWARARARFLDLDSTGQNIGADSTVGSFSAGAQVALGGDVRLGFAAGYDSIALGTGTGASADGERADLGAVAKYNPGPWLFSAAVAGGWGDYDTTRNMAFGRFAGQASGDSDVDYLQGRLHAAYLIQQAGWYAKPLIDATLTELDFDGGTETAAAARRSSSPPTATPTGRSRRRWRSAANTG